MKNIFKIALVALLSLSLVACGGEEPTEPVETEETVETEGCPVKIGLVTDTGGVDDKSFNQSSWEGLVQFAKDNGLSYGTDSDSCVRYLQSASEADYIPNLSAFADEGCDLVMAIGFLFNSSVAEVAPLYPDTKFLIVDEAVEGENVTSAVFSAEQGGFLVGVAAGLEAAENGSNQVGFMGGMEGPIIGAFQAGYEQGVLAANPECKIYIEYSNSFDDDTIGQNLAKKMYDAGATVVFQAAGACGNGVIREARERQGEVWAIGVDKDQYEDGILESGDSIILTSMLKRVDRAVYQVAEDLLNGELEAGTRLFDLTNEGVGAEVTEGRNLSEETIATILDYAAKIEAGELTVSAEPTIAAGSTN